MREYGKVHMAFWSDPSIRGMSEDARALALYLLTCPHGNLLGLFRLPIAYAADDLQWASERVSKGFTELFGKGFCRRDSSTDWLVILKFLRWNPVENANVAISAERLFVSIPECEPKYLCAQAILLNPKHFSEPFRKGIETVSKQYRTPEPLPEPLPEPEPLPLAKSAVPLRPPAERQESKTAEIWKRYSAAYANRYHTEPSRNAKINGQLANIVDRLGAEEAPLVAEWFLQHNDRWYAQKGHSVEALQKDCEKIRMEWATGNRITATKAAQMDRTQATGDVFRELIEESRLEKSNAN